MIKALFKLNCVHLFKLQHYDTWQDLPDDIAPAPNHLLSGDYEDNANKAKFHFKAIEVQEIRDALPKSINQIALALITSLAIS